VAFNMLNHWSDSLNGGPERFGINLEAPRPLSQLAFFIHIDVRQ
jgi:hypothetical protein